MFSIASKPGLTRLFSTDSTSYSTNSLAPSHYTRFNSHYRATYFLLALDLLLTLLLKTSVCAVWKVLAYRLIITCPNIRTTYGGHVRTDKYMISVKPNQWISVKPTVTAMCTWVFLKLDWGNAICLSWSDSVIEQWKVKLAFKMSLKGCLFVNSS